MSPTPCFIQCASHIFVKMKLMMTRVIFFCVTFISLGLATQNGLVCINDCICPNQSVTYECSVVGGQSTVWRGSALGDQCEIILNHKQIDAYDPKYMVCNNRTVVAQLTRQDNNCYTSRLTFFVSSNHSGRSIECLVHDGINEILINTTTLQIPSNAPPPLANVDVNVDSLAEVTFNLREMEYCPSLTYGYYCEFQSDLPSSHNCLCYKHYIHDSTSITKLNCQYVGYGSSGELHVSIHSIICNRQISTEKIFSINLTALNHHSFECNPYYSNSDKALLKLVTTFSNLTKPFITSNGTESNITSYNVTYWAADIDDSRFCGSAAIPASSCKEGLCRHEFEVSSSSCPSTDISIAVLANSNLGRGRLTPTLIRDRRNNFIDVKFDQNANTFICIFLNQPPHNDNKCSITITYGTNCDRILGIYSGNDTMDSVTVTPIDFIKGIDEYCYTVKARVLVSVDHYYYDDVYLMVSVVGNLTLKAPWRGSGLDSNIIVAIFVPMILIIGILTIVILLIVLVQRIWNKYHLRPFSNIRRDQDEIIETSDSDTGLLIPQNICQHDHLNVHVVIGELTIYKEEKLGSGMFGYVFLGKMQDKPCAVKVLHEVGMELTSNLSTTSGKRGKVQDERLKSFKREHDCLLGLKHPNIVELIDICLYPRQNLPCLVMELLDCSLRGFFKENLDGIPVVNQISLNADIAKALAYLHKNKMIHRDLCGDNVLILKGNNDLVAKIADFGMSRIIDTQAMTHSLSVLGHRSGYLPPEGPLQDYDLSLDIYMFGVVMVQIVNAVEDIRCPTERNELIEKVNDAHPLKKFIDRCVVDSKTDRPTAKVICNELVKLLGAHTASPKISLEGTNEANVGALSDII